MDVLLITTGICFIALHYNSSLLLDTYTLAEVWDIAARKEIAEVFGSITILLAYFRVLDYLTLWKFLGVLIITIFKMFADILRFLLVFTILAIGFSTAFHISYTGNGIDTWNDFFGGTLTTFISSYTGYYVPDYYNLLAFAGPAFGLIIQVIWIFVGIILLLNLLIALLWDTYAVMSEKANLEYRWLITKPFKSGFSVLWPAPFTILHVVLLLISSLFDYCGLGEFRRKYMQSKEQVSLRVIPTNSSLLGKAMISNLFKNELKEEYKKFVLYGNKVFVDQ